MQGCGVARLLPYIPEPTTVTCTSRDLCVRNAKCITWKHTHTHTFNVAYSSRKEAKLRKDYIHGHHSSPMTKKIKTKGFVGAQYGTKLDTPDKGGCA